MGIFDYYSLEAAAGGEDACNNCNIESKIILKSYSSTFCGFYLLKHLIIFFPLMFLSPRMGIFGQREPSPALSCAIMKKKKETNGAIYPFELIS